jgi:hypothetical protein
MAHGGKLEIFAPQQISVAEIKRDEVDAGHEQKEQRHDVDQQHDDEEFQREPGACSAGIAARRIGREIRPLDLRRDVVEIEPAISEVTGG